MTSCPLPVLEFPAGLRDAVAHKEFRALRAPAVWHPLVLAALVNGATFATFAYLAVVATDVAGFGVGAALVSRVLTAATEAPTLGGSFATVALNVGAVLGPMLAGAVDAVWLSVALSTLALVLLPFLGREPHDLRVVQSGR